MFFAGTDGIEAVDVPEVAGGGAGDCGVGVCAGRPSGTGEGAADEGGGGFFEVEGRVGCCGASGQADGEFPVLAGLLGSGGGDDQ